MAIDKCLAQSHHVPLVSISIVFPISSLILISNWIHGSSGLSLNSWLLEY